MIIAGVVLAVLAAGAVGFILGWATRGHRVEVIEREIELKERARTQGQIDALRASVRPSIQPPSDYFRGNR